MRESAKLRPPDYLLLGTVIGLVAAGLLLVFDASYAKAADLGSMNHDPYYLVKRQAMFAAFGFLCLLVASRLAFSTLRKTAALALAVALVGLVVVLVIGHVSHGSKAWIRLGPISVQPSEFAKIALVVYLATSLSSWQTFAKGRPRRWVKPAFWCGVTILLVVMERDLGVAALLYTVCGAMFFAAGAKKRWLVLLAAVGVLGAVLAIAFIPHCQARWRAFKDPWAYRFSEGYQTVHSLVGIASGGIDGVGFCRGRVKFYMPASSTDYVYATLVEEMGLIGGVALLVMFGVFTYRGLHIAHRSKSVFGSVLASGIVALVGSQTAINMAVVTSAIPATGLPLPFISYGGSGMVTMLSCVGILLSVSRQVDVVVERRDLDEDSTGGRGNRRSYLPGVKRRAGVEKTRTVRRVAVRR